MNKVCNKCKNEYPATLEYFRKSILGKFGFSSECKKCLKDRWISIPREKKDKYNENKRNWLKSNPDKKQERKKYRKEYNKKNPSIIQKMKKIYYEKHREYVIEKSKEYRKNNPGYSKLSHEENSKKKSDRRARKLLVGGTFTKKDVLIKLENQKNLCFYCKKILDGYHVDHYYPLAKGGSNSIENIVIACPSCNLRKGALLPDEFMERIK